MAAAMVVRMQFRGLYYVKILPPIDLYYKHNLVVFSYILGLLFLAQLQYERALASMMASQRNLQFARVTPEIDPAKW